MLLSVENDTTFPLIFVRENCADMALTEDDIDPALIASAKAIVVTGTHFSRPNTDAAQRKAMRIAREAGRKVVFDIDYRPNLWGLAGHAAGEERYIKSDRVSEHLQTVLPGCDLVVGTEEEMRIAGGGDDALSVLRKVRSLTDATLVLKRGPMGCVVFPGPIPDRIDDGIVGRGFPDRGPQRARRRRRLHGRFPARLAPRRAARNRRHLGQCLRRLRRLASPLLARVSDLGGAVRISSGTAARTMPSARTRPSTISTGRPRAGRNRKSLMALAIDHRIQLEAMADRAGVPRAASTPSRCWRSKPPPRSPAGGQATACSSTRPMAARRFFAAARQPFWLGRPVEQPGSRPLRFEFDQDIGGRLAEWPVTHTVKCLAFFHPDDDTALKAEQTEKLRTLYQAARRNGLELLVEIIAGKNGPLDDATVATVLDELYAAGIKPDWWKLEPQATAAAWDNIAAVIGKADPWCRGVVLLGLEAPEKELEAAFATCADAPVVKGFAVGRTIFNDAAEKWLSGKIDDKTAVDDMASRFSRLTGAWQRVRGAKAA